MKTTLKKSLSVLLAVMLLAGCLALAGCGEKKDEAAGDAEMIKIGIIQMVEHPSLDTIRESCIAQLETLGYVDGENIEIDYQNGQGDGTNLKTISQQFVANGCDLIIAITTPAAQAVVGETSEIPVVFAACTDPVAAGLVKDLALPGGNVTGTSDAVSAQQIMDLALQITPDIKTIGALYNAGETNSVSVIEDLKEYAKAKGITVTDATVTASSEVQTAVSALAGKVDAVFSPIDNTVASAMPVVAKTANEAKLPVYVSADSMVSDGGLATYGINYTILGQETANMVAEVLSGTNPGDIPVMTMTDMNIYINQKTADALGIVIPEELAAKATFLPAAE